MNPEEKVVVVIIDDTIHTDTPYGRAISRISNGLADFDIEVVTIASLEGARSASANLPAADCILINWNLGGTDDHSAAKLLIHEIRRRNEDIPIFLIADPFGEAPVELTVDTVREINEYVYVMEDTPEFISGRITAAAKRYKDRLLPPFFKALVNFSKDFEYSWHTPGHAGGTAFRITRIWRT